MRAALSAAVLGVAACAPAGPVPSPADPPAAVADAAIPFADPYRADLVGSADRLMRTLGQAGADCVEARFLRVPAARAATIRDHYAAAADGWRQVPLDAPPFTTASAFRRDDTWFAVAVADRPQRGWTGIAIATNSVWDAASRDALVRCRGR